MQFLLFDFILLVKILLCFASITEARTNNTSSLKLIYPSAHRINKTWSFRSAKANGNMTYIDPYYWMESSPKNKDIQQFLSEQSKLTKKYIQGCKNKEIIIDSLTEASSFDRYSDVQLVSSATKGDLFYLYKLVRVTDVAPIWYIASLTEFQKAKKVNFQNPPGKAFFNESLLSSDGSVEIGRSSVSPDGTIFGYRVVGEDGAKTWYFRKFNSPLLNVKSTLAGGENRLDDIIYFGAADDLYWMPDSKGFFYSQQNDLNGGTNTDHGYRTRYHIFGTNSTNDITVFDSKKAGKYGPDTYYYLRLSPDGQWLVISSYHDISNYNSVAYATSLTKQNISSNMKWISLAPEYEFAVLAGGIIGDTYYFWTNKDTQNGKVAKYHLDWNKAKQIKSSFTELQDRELVIDVIPERKDALITNGGVFITATDKVIVIYIEEGQMVLYAYHVKIGKLIKKLIANETIYVDDLTGDQNSNTSILFTESWNTPSKIFEFKWDGMDVEESIVTIRHVNHSDPNDFAIQKLHATSKDGTKVPYFITYRKGTEKPGPVYLHAYGAGGFIDNLFYQPNYFEFLRSYDGFFVWAGVRGGGDEGGFWHKAGSGLHKEKTFDDIIAIAEDVVKLGYTIPGNIIIEGVSAGGLAMAAVINKAPAGLIGLALPARAPCDAFQFELRTTIGAVNRAEYGDVTTPEGFDAVRAWSPLQNVDPHKPYPAVLLTPGSNDETVPPSSTYKFLAQLQYDHPNNTLPLLMYVVDNIGHVPGTTLESTFQLCIMEQALNIKRRQVHHNK